jgi:tetratricopeptide (TPR) repeat protein
MSKRQRLITTRLAFLYSLLILQLMVLTAVAGEGSNGEFATSAVNGTDLSYRYAINLQSSLVPVERSDLPRLELFKTYQLYTTLHTERDKTWHRWRLGFFRTRKEAEQVMDTLVDTFRDAWVTKVSLAERKYVVNLFKEIPDITVEKPTPSESIAETDKLPLPDEPEKKVEQEKPIPEQEHEDRVLKPSDNEEKLEKIMREAEEEMTNGNYRRAIQLYTKVLQSSNHIYLQDAQEYLGLARERNGQIAHAKAEYEKYLELYPDGAGAERVRQRLAGILTARAKPKEKLRQAKREEEAGKWQSEVVGSFSQFYYRDVSFTDPDGETVNQSTLSSDIDVDARSRNDDFDIRMLLIGGYDADFLDEGDSDGRVSRLYLDILNRRINTSGRIGRQSRSTGGVLGRFDGASLSYQLSSYIKVDGVFGFPVDSSTSMNIETDKRFYGFSLDLGTFKEHWDFNTFIINQDVDGITDRRAVGGEIRYFQPERSFFSLVDYDISYRELNTFLFVGNWMFPTKTTFNISLSYRKSPVLTTSNALISQSVSSVADLLNIYSEEEVRTLAEDRTSTTQSLTIGASHPLNQKFQVSGDLAVSKMSGTDASGGVEATSGTGYEYFFSSQIIGNSLLKEGDIAILGARYSDTDAYQAISFNLNTRYPVNRKWRINPRFQFDYRTKNQNNGTQSTIKPSLRMDYRWNRRARFEFEAGGEWSDEKLTDQTDRTSSYFFNSGYRINF